MATFNTNKASATVPVKVLASRDITVIGSYAILAALALNDVIVGPSIPAGATLISVRIDVPQLDTGGSPALKFDVGTAATPAKFISASTIGQTGGIATASVAGTIGYSPTSNTPVQAKVNTGPQTGATSGTVVIAVTYTMDA